MKIICAWLAEDAGIILSVTSLTSYSPTRRTKKGIGALKLHGRSRSGPISLQFQHWREPGPRLIAQTRVTQQPDDPEAMRVLLRPKMDICGSDKAVNL